MIDAPKLHWRTVWLCGVSIAPTKARGERKRTASESLNESEGSGVGVRKNESEGSGVGVRKRTASESLNESEGSGVGI